LKDIRDGGYYGTADNTFPLWNELLILFCASQLNVDGYKDSYNYYLSQLWIWIEMALRRLTGKFGLLQHQMKCNLVNTEHGTPSSSQTLLLEMQKAAISHGGWVLSWGCGVAKEKRNN
jgi:hypothetical protein